MKNNNLLKNTLLITFIISIFIYTTVISLALSKSNKQETPKSKEPFSITVLVNKNIHLSSNHVPQDLVIPNVYGASPAVKMRKEAALAYEKMTKKAALSKIILIPISAYRSYSVQKNIFSNKVKKYGSEKNANLVSARPGESEHQTGFAIDISSKSVKYGLVPSFYSTKEGQWLKNNCQEFGFVLRYPQNKTSITGYAFEPWHYRYVGVKAAKEIMKKGLTLEEYL